MNSSLLGQFDVNSHHHPCWHGRGKVAPIFCRPTVKLWERRPGLAKLISWCPELIWGIHSGSTFSHFLPGWWLMIDYSTDNMCLMSSRFKFHWVLGNARSDSYWVFGDLVVLWTLCCCRRWLKRRKRMLVERRKFGNLRERRNTRELKSLALAASCWWASLQ